MSWALPLTDIRLEPEDITSVLECLEGGWLTMGPKTQEFEQAIAALCQVPFAIAVSSGTAALHLALLAAGIGPGDEVLVPAMTFVAGPAAVRYCGASPVFVEVCGPDDLNLDPEDAARLLGPRTRAVLATHWMGYACDLAPLEALCKEHDLVLIEDACQSITAKTEDGRLTGTVGDAGCLSFFSKKQLCVGEGGMVLTSDQRVADHVRLLRSHAMTSVTWDRHRGHAESYDVVDVGFNFRIDEPRAALGLSRLARLAQDIDHRRAVAQRYRRRLRSVEGVTIPWNEEQVQRSAHFGFPIVLKSAAQRAFLVSELESRGVQSTRYPALTSLTAYRDHPRRERTEDLAGRHLLLPLSSILEIERVDEVADYVEDIIAAGVTPAG